MFEKIDMYMWHHPERVIAMGRHISLAALWMAFCGLAGYLITTAANLPLPFAGKPAGVKSLTDIYPAVPLWWVPETLAGILFVAFLFACGVSLSKYGRYMQRARQ